MASEDPWWLAWYRHLRSIEAVTEPSNAPKTATILRVAWCHIARFVGNAFRLHKTSFPSLVWRGEYMPIHAMSNLEGLKR